jgi:DNA-binding transcriptional regulator YhcF (GntR family)
VRQIAEELGVNPNTVHKAIVAIEREGILEAERGKGMIVKSGSGALARSASEDAVLRHLAEAAQLAETTGMSEERFNQLVQRARRDTASQQGDRS